MLYKKGLAYQAEALVNYDPVDKTVLANEQVHIVTGVLRLLDTDCVVRSMPTASRGGPEQRSKS